MKKKKRAHMREQKAHFLMQRKRFVLFSNGFCCFITPMKWIKKPRCYGSKRTGRKCYIGYVNVRDYYLKGFRYDYENV